MHFRNPPRMDIAIDRRPGAEGVELVVAGRLDAESAAELRDAVTAEVRTGHQAITLDLAAVSFLSSAGIRILFETQREARAAGGDCLVATPSPAVRKVLELTRLDRVLMLPAAKAAKATPAAADRGGRELEAGGVRLMEFQPPHAGPLTGRLHGSAAALAGSAAGCPRVSLPPHAFAFGIGAVADAAAVLPAAGELLAAGGCVYHRGPRPFAAVDYLLGSGDLVPETDLVTGVSWHGFPSGRAAFEPGADAAAVAVDDLAAAVLRESGADCIALVLAGEVQGLIAAELIRPLSEATPADHPLLGSREAAARWLCFSREPVHAGRTALVVGIVARASRGPLAGDVAPLGPAGVVGHLHAVVFPHRPIRRAAGDLAAVLADLSASEPLAVLHLMADDRPVLGNGRSEFIRGGCWFAPLELGENST